MAKEELFKILILGSIMRNVGTFPVRRGAATVMLSVKVLRF